MTTIEEMQAHVDALIEAIGVIVHRHQHPFYGWACMSYTTPPELWIPEVENWRDYLTCLHELGHAHYRHDRPVIIEAGDKGLQYIEAQAWSWAFRNSIVSPTLEMRLWAFETENGGGLSSYDFTQPPSDPDAAEFVGGVRDYLLGATPGLVTT